MARSGKKGSRRPGDVYDDYGYNGFSDGYDGFDDEYEDGYDDGYDDLDDGYGGYDDAYGDGYDDAYDDGYDDAYGTRRGSSRSARGSRSVKKSRSAKSSRSAKKSRSGRRKKRNPFLSVFLALFKLMLVLVLIGGMFTAGYGAIRLYPEFKEIREHAVSTFTNMDESDFRRMTDTEIFDTDEKVIGVISAGHYVYDPFDDISEHIRNAYVAQEDRRFYSHSGVDVIAIMRAVVSYVRHGGKVTQGGSTITQQVIKNTYLSQERTLERKLTEIMIAPELERRFGKDRIMEFYCNGNYYAHGCYGVEAASRYYFDKTAAEVEPWEAALLAGISNRPASYDPVAHPEAALEKRNRVLKSMAECGYITDDELEEYTKKPLDIAKATQANTAERYQTSYAVHCAALALMKADGFEFRYGFKDSSEREAYQEEYREAYGEKSELIRGGGYKIHTSIDSSVQSALQKQLDDTLSVNDELQDNGKYALQGAAVVIDNRTGRVAAIVGGRGIDDAYNRAFLSTRQPGSSVKPLLDYAPAFETGYFYPSKLMNDHEFEGGPKNSGGKYYGIISIREALNRSLNTIAWQLLDGIGISSGLSYLEKMHFTSVAPEDYSAKAVSIGGFTNGLRVIDMAKGYSTLANGGIYNDGTCLVSVVYDKTGETLYDGSSREIQVYTPGTAYILTDVLKGTMDQPFGTGRGLDIDGQEAAGKTGTTNDSKDTWFCGYTRYYSMACWVGYDTPRAMPGIYGSTYAGAIWHNVMTKIHDGLPKKDWDMPESVIRAAFDPATGDMADYDTGVYDLFDLSVNPDAKEAYEARRETAESDPGVLPTEPSSSEEESTEESLPEETAESMTVEPVTGVDGGPGVTMPGENVGIRPGQDPGSAAGGTGNAPGGGAGLLHPTAPDETEAYGPGAPRSDGGNTSGTGTDSGNDADSGTSSGSGPVSSPDNTDVSGSGSGNTDSSGIGPGNTDSSGSSSGNTDSSGSGSGNTDSPGTDTDGGITEIGPGGRSSSGGSSGEGSGETRGTLRDAPGALVVPVGPGMQ